MQECSRRRWLHLCPILKAMRATVVLESGTIVSGLLGATFKMVIKQLQLVGTAPTATEGMPVALMADAAATARRLEEILSQLEGELKDLAYDTGRN